MEIWKDIKGYEGLYQVSNHGRVKSLSRYSRSGRVLNTSINPNGCHHVGLSNGKQKTRTIHQLVAEAFLGHIPCGYKLVVDHRDHDRSNNHIDNLRLITQRENTNLKHKKSSSKFTGVSWAKASNKWLAQIQINGKDKNLGYFSDELEALQAYEKALTLTLT